MAVQKNTNQNVKKKDTPKLLESNKNKNGKLIYIGPNLIQMTKYTVFNGGIPKHVASLIKKCPAVEKLLIPVEELTKREPKIKKQGTLEHKYYQEVLSFLSEQRKGDKQ